jgi:hypothetical protein
MFVNSPDNRQRDLFDDILMTLPEAKRMKAINSPQYGFFREIFCRIDEAPFAVLYPASTGRPNAPVNAMVAALVLRELRGWTYDELFERIDFDMLTRLALGLCDMADSPFCYATLFNFQQRLLQHETTQGVNLLEQTFRLLTAQQLRRFAVDGSIQRADSFRAMSNIARYGRVRLLVEVLIRLHRILNPTDQARFAEAMAPYVADSSEHYVYRLEDAALPRHLDALASLYARLHAELGEAYAHEPAYQTFARVLAEQFELGDDGAIRVRERREISSGSLQSPDDPDATYNAKCGKPQRGHKVNVTETAHPDNDLDLITDVAVDANNVHDGTQLAERLASLKELTPELAELHTDGGYGSSVLDPEIADRQILHVETGSIIGHGEVPFTYSTSDAGEITVSCPHQSVKATPTAKQLKATFAPAICAECPLRDSCRSIPRRAGRYLYFDRQVVSSYQRSQNIHRIPESRRKLRANVEATMKAFTGLFNHKGKLRVRGRARARLQILSAAIAINFGRLYRHLAGLSDPTATSASRPSHTVGPWAACRPLPAIWPAQYSPLAGIIARPRPTTPQQHAA